MDTVLYAMLKNKIIEATYDDTEIRQKLLKVIEDVNTINGNGEGSINRTIADEIAKVVADAPESFNTLKELSDWINLHSEDAADMNSRIVQNTNNIANKLDKNQGVNNSGKIAGINESGDIVPMFPMGVKYNEDTNCLEFGADKKLNLNAGIQLDDTLSKKGYAADAGVTGKAVDELKGDLTEIEKRTSEIDGTVLLKDWEIGGYTLSDGVITLTNNDRRARIKIYAKKDYVLNADFVNIVSALRLTHSDNGVSGWSEIIIVKSEYVFPDDGWYYIMLTQIDETDKHITNLRSVVDNVTLYDPNNMEEHFIALGNKVDELSYISVEHGEFANDTFIDYRNGNEKHYANNPSDTTYRATGFLPCYGSILKTNIGAVKNAGLAFYDKYKIFIEGHYVSTTSERLEQKEIEIPSNAVWYRNTSQNMVELSAVLIDNVKGRDKEIFENIYAIRYNSTENPCDFSGDDICLFSKGICIGDSLTAGVVNYNTEIDKGNIQYVAMNEISYPTKLSKLTGIEITNSSQGGATSSEYYSAHSSDDWSGNQFAIVQFGTNDAIRYSGWTDTSQTAFNNIIQKLKTENPHIVIFVSTTLPVPAYSGASYDSVSNGIKALVNGLNDANVIFVDLLNYSHVGDDVAYAQGHLTAYGYSILAKDYKSFISKYISDHKAQFKFAHYFGTDKWYY